MQQNEWLKQQKASLKLAPDLMTNPIFTHPKDFQEKQDWPMSDMVLVVGHHWLKHKQQDWLHLLTTHLNLMGADSQ